MMQVKIPLRKLATTTYVIDALKRIQKSGTAFAKLILMVISALKDDAQVKKVLSNLKKASSEF